MSSSFNHSGIISKNNRLVAFRSLACGDGARSAESFYVGSLCDAR